MGARYLGGYIRDDEFKHDWLKKRMVTWELEAMGKYPQESYAAVGREIQS